MDEKDRGAACKRGNPYTARMEMEDEIKRIKEKNKTPHAATLSRDSPCYHA